MVLGVMVVVGLDTSTLMVAVLVLRV